MCPARNKKKSQKISSNRSLTLRAYTVIEILIVVVIMTLLFGVGTASYRSFQRRKELEGAANKVKVDLRLAQEMAMSGVGNDECGSGEAMVATMFEANSPEYFIKTRCSDETNTYDYTVVTRNLEPDYTNIDLSGGPVIFNILGRGVVSDETIKITQTTGTCKNIEITKGGEINVTDCL